MKRQKKMKKTKRGFTLIELLVVIAIIALLLAILMPALGKAKDKAKQIVCKSNLKGIGLCVKLYLSENKDKAPPKFGGYYGWINPVTNREYELTDPDGEFKSSYWGVTFKDYAKDKKIFSCPSFAQFRLNMDEFYVLYVIDDNTIEGGFGINPYFAGVKVSKIRSPSEYIITQDHAEPLPESRADKSYDLFFIAESKEYNVHAYRDAAPGTPRYDQYRAIFRHSKKNTALDRPEDVTRRANINNNPNGQSDTLRLDGSVDAMYETTGENVRKSWYTGEQ